MRRAPLPQALSADALGAALPRCGRPSVAHSRAPAIAASFDPRPLRLPSSESFGPEQLSLWAAVGALPKNKPTTRRKDDLDFYARLPDINDIKNAYFKVQ